ncbi:Arm DNA-binding domain-containing protein [Parasphingorhabdus litoris]|uniref:Arm DNA-binding domain-containing protein n=1 Tax=Parasphingorhabdus litoris TaxID=394733 RepID=UPI002DDBA05B|nr:Arm DNA-binding domain-containing protein [Parasphingorhabdus litoris]
MKGRWRLRTSINGRRRDIGLGSLSLVSLAEASESAYLMRKDIHNGLDPIAERKKRSLSFRPLGTLRNRSMPSVVSPGRAASTKSNG